MEGKFRSYGPGKFDTILDAYVYEVSLDDGGCDMECGSVENGHWYGLMRHGHTIFKNHDPNREALNDFERDFLTSQAGCILSEDSDGFVSVAYYEDMAELDKAWLAIEQEQAKEEETIE